VPSRSDLIGAALTAIRRLGTEVDGLDQRAASHFGISRTDLHLIDRLRSEGPQAPSELARSVGLTSGGLSIALERLERIGYIRRSQHPDDRRRVVVEATEAIVPLEKEVFGPLIREMTSLLATYNNRNLATIRDYLDRTANIISQSAPGASPAPDAATVGPATTRRSEPHSRKQATKAPRREDHQPE
jgi:DNA-binding MarR family transcriptional regulator